MNGEPSQISFIPKKTLEEDDVFITRQRPRSFLGLLAALLFLGSVGAYIGFYFYEDLLSRDIQKKTVEIEAAKRTLSSSPEISRARVFNARADIARTLLGQHIIVSPIFDFLSQNTLGGIFYTNFSFKDEGGVSTLSLKGESPNYSSLAYQADVFRARKELLRFSIDSIELTRNGSVSFNITMVFDRAILSYEKLMKTEEPVVTQRAISSTTTVKTISPSMSSTSVPIKNTKGTVSLPSIKFL